MSQEWRRSRAYRIWRFLVIWRDKVCRCCGSRKKRHAHHIKDAATHPELRFEVDNGITLCNDCHKFVHNEIAGGYRAGCSEYELKILLELTYHRTRMRNKLNRVLRALS